MDREEFRRIQTRRSFFEHCAGGIGIAALSQLMASEGRAAANSALADVNPLAPKKPHFPAKAKNVIFMFMEGGPSQLDLFDPKPALQKWSGQPLPPEMTKDLRLAFTKPNAAVLASPRTFTALRSKRHRVFRLHPQHRLLRRRPVPGPVHVYRRLQPPPRPVTALRRQHSGWPPHHGRVGLYGLGSESPTCPDSWCSVPA